MAWNLLLGIIPVPVVTFSDVNGLNHRFVSLAGSNTYISMEDSQTQRASWTDRIPDIHCRRRGKKLVGRSLSMRRCQVAWSMWWIVVARRYWFVWLRDFESMHIILMEDSQRNKSSDWRGGTKLHTVLRYEPLNETWPTLLCFQFWCKSPILIFKSYKRRWTLVIYV